MTLALVIALLAGAVTAAPATAAPPAQPPAGGAVLDIPYVPQSEALCGGAAAAMVLRYWGARDVVAEDFAPLLNPDGSGIRVDRLAAAVRARGWQAVALTGTAAIVRAQLAKRRPVIALISVGHGRYHYVVVAAWTDGRVIADDPARAPGRVYRITDFESAWAAARHWMLVILPGSKPPAGGRADAAREAPPAGDGASGSVSSLRTRCDAIVDNAVARAEQAGRETALTGAVAECPASARAHRELAGYQLVHGAAADAAKAAAAAVRLDPGDADAWYLLGAARYLTHDPAAALEAWNHVGEPRLDLITVEGLGRASYRSVADTVGIARGEVITAEALARARRRVGDLPAIASSRVDLEPRGQGEAQIDVGVVERSTAPRSWSELAIAGVRAGIDREVAETFADVNGSGDAWTAGWRWWENRPRVAVSMAAPGLLGSEAVWRVDGSWEAQSYAGGAALLRTDRLRAALTASNWMTGRWKWTASSGLDRWGQPQSAPAFQTDPTRPTTAAPAGPFLQAYPASSGAFWFGGAGLERRTADDRGDITAGATLWAGAARFARISAEGDWTSRVAPQGWRLLASGGASFATAAAPLDLWEGAGQGHARAALLRAHPLLDSGIIVGPAFGRALEHATISVERWPATMRLWGIGVAGFVDAAAAQHRLVAGGPAAFADAGAGVRLRAAWLPGVVRVDYAHGLTDGANAVSIGWESK